MLKEIKSQKVELVKDSITFKHLFQTYNEKDYQEHIDAGNFDPFREVELICSQFIGLEYYETPLFSALLPPDFIQKRKEELGLNDA